MKNYKKFISLALTLAMILSAVFCTGVVANAEDTAPTANDVTKVTFSTTEADMDWSDLGPNLIPDSTVSEFNEDGTYKKYYEAESYDAVRDQKIANPNAWWASTTEGNTGYNGNGNDGYKGIGALASGTTVNESHTDDRTGALVCTTTKGYDVRMLPMNASTTNSYYLLSFWIKTTGGKNVTMHFRSINDNAIKDNVSVATTTGWTRVMYIVSVTTRGLNKVSVVFDKSQDIYIDEVELYKLDGQYAQDCLEAGKLLNGNDEYYAGQMPNGYDDVYTPGDDYTNIDFSTFGTNLCTDPTVKEFDAKGSYKNNGFFAISMCDYKYTLPANGAIVNDSTLSRTDDGSGVLKLTNKGMHLIDLPNLEAYSAYLITFWVKDSSPDLALKYNIYGYNYSLGTKYAEIVYDASKYENSGEWHRVSFIYHRKASPMDNVGLAIEKTTASGTLYADDFAIYKLDAKYALSCLAVSESRPEPILLPTDGHGKDDNDDSEDVVIETDNYIHSTERYNDINFDSFGDNLFSDPTVAAENFTDDGTGKMVYNATSVFGIAPTGKYSFRSYAVNDNSESRTKNDNSGVIKIENGTECGFLLPEWEANSAYLITFWVKSSTDDTRTITLFDAVKWKNYTDPIIYEPSVIGSANEWHRVSFIVTKVGYRASKNIAIMIGKGNATFYVDDVAVYKLDSAYALKCVEKGELIKNNEAEKKDPVSLSVTEAKSTVDATTIADGYFVPYGAFAKKDDGTMAVKLGNGRFYVENAGDYSYTQFKYPTGIVGTFGASAKTTGKSGIQFGSLVTDNLSVEDGGTGTLLFRGKFDDFCKTFPTKTTKQVAADIYNKIKKYEADNGKVCEKCAFTFTHNGVKIDAMYVPQTKYMWKNSEQTQLQYAVRVYGITENELAGIDFTAIGYVKTKDGNMVFSNELKTKNYNELSPQN